MIHLSKDIYTKTTTPEEKIHTFNLMIKTQTLSLFTLQNKSLRETQT